MRSSMKQVLVIRTCGMMGNVFHDKQNDGSCINERVFTTKCEKYLVMHLCRKNLCGFGCQVIHNADCNCRVFYICLPVSLSVCWTQLWSAQWFSMLSLHHPPERPVCPGRSEIQHFSTHFHGLVLFNDACSSALN